MSTSNREWAWERARTIRGKNPKLHRRDEIGNEMCKPAFGTTEERSWKIDHKNPVSKGGTDHRRNLRVLNTEANRKKGNRAN